MHFYPRNELKQQWAWMVKAAMVKAKFPQHIEKPVEIFIEYGHPKRCVDLDNYTPKFIIDPIRDVITDDNIERVIKLGWTFVKSKNKYSKVTVTEI